MAYTSGLRQDLGALLASFSSFTWFTYFYLWNTPNTWVLTTAVTLSKPPSFCLAYDNSFLPILPLSLRRYSLYSQYDDGDHLEARVRLFYPFYSNSRMTSCLSRVGIFKLPSPSMLLHLRSFADFLFEKCMSTGPCLSNRPSALSLPISRIFLCVFCKPWDGSCNDHFRFPFEFAHFCLRKIVAIRNACFLV